MDVDRKRENFCIIRIFVLVSVHRPSLGFIRLVLGVSLSLMSAMAQHRATCLEWHPSFVDVLSCPSLHLFLS